MTREDFNKKTTNRINGVIAKLDTGSLLHAARTLRSIARAAETQQIAEELEARRVERTREKVQRCAASHGRRRTSR